MASHLTGLGHVRFQELSCWSFSTLTLPLGTDVSKLMSYDKTSLHFRVRACVPPDVFFSLDEFFCCCLSAFSQHFPSAFLELMVSYKKHHLVLLYSFGNIKSLFTSERLANTMERNRGIGKRWTLRVLSAVIAELQRICIDNQSKNQIIWTQAFVHLFRNKYHEFIYFLISSQFCHHDSCQAEMPKVTTCFL